MTNKIVSLCISLYCVVVVLSIEGPSGLAIAIALIPLLFCIWFGDFIGSITGFGGFRHPVVNRESPGCLVSGLAWVVLVLLAGVLTKRII